MAIDLVQWAWLRLVRYRRSGLLAANDAFQPHLLHQPGYRAAGYIKPFPAHLSPDLAHAVDLEVGNEYALDRGTKFSIPFGSIRA